MTTVEKPLADLVQELPPEIQAEVRDFVEFLLEKRRRAELEQIAVAHGWPPGFASTAGSIDDPTFVRHPQGEYEERLPLE